MRGGVAFSSTISLWSTVDFDDVAIGIEEVSLWKACRPIAPKSQPPRIAIRPILPKTLCDQPSNTSLEIIGAEREMPVGRVYGRRTPEGPGRIDDDVDLQRPAGKPRSVRAEGRPLDLLQTEDIAIEGDRSGQIRGNDRNVMQHHRTHPRNRCDYAPTRAARDGG